MDTKKLGMWAALVVALGLGGYFAKQKGLLGGGADSAEEADAKGGARARAKGAGGSAGGGAGGAREGVPEGQGDAEAAPPEPELGTHAAKLREAKAALETMTFALEEYKKSSRWPESARPAEEMAPGGGLLPHHTAPTVAPLIKRLPNGKPDPESAPSKARVVHALDRYNLGPDDSVTVNLHALNEKDAELPLRCASASAMAGSPTGAPPPAPLPPVALSCKPSTADKGMFVTFVPKQSPFRAFNGNIVFEFDLEVDRDDGTKESGMTRINVNYNPASGGKLTGAVREAYENGSIAYYLGFEAAGAGFARLNVRADNGADDGVFAHINIRQELDKAGPTELRAELFGKLIVDGNVTKVRLRDVDGEFIATESGVSAQVPGKDGVFYVAKPVDRSKIKGDDWSAPEKAAKLHDLETSVKEAQENCDKNFDGCK